MENILSDYEEDDDEDKEDSKIPFERNLLAPASGKTVRVSPGVSAADREDGSDDVPGGNSSSNPNNINAGRQSTVSRKSGTDLTRRQSQAIVAGIKKQKLQSIKDKKFENSQKLISEEIKYLFFYISNATGITVEKIVDQIAGDIDSDNQIELILDFLDKGGRRGLSFYYQEDEKRSSLQATDIPQTKGRKTISEWRSFQSLQKLAPTVSKFLFVTDGTKEPLTGVLLYFIKTSNVDPIKMHNIADLLIFNVVSVSAGGGILPGLASHLRNRVISSVDKSKERCIGALVEKRGGEDEWEDIRNEYHGFADYLDAMHKSLDAIVQMETPNDFLLEYLETCLTAAEIKIAARNEKVLPHVETQVAIWIGHLEAIVTDFNMVRREKGESGPLTELEFWRTSAIKFSSIIDFIKSHNCKTCVLIISAAKSKVLLTRWRAVDRRITDAVNESKDNTRFLYSLESLVRPLYRPDPDLITQAIPKLIRQLAAINTTSRFFNTSERMTSLFIKITNQMVISLTAYLTNRGKRAVWALSYDDLISKCRKCIETFETYLDQYHQAMERAANNPGERPFEFSEMYIFGKFRAFCVRISKILEAAMFGRSYSKMRRSLLEGVDPLMRKFDKIMAWVKGLPVNPLAYRDQTFDGLFEKFRDQVCDFEETVSALFLKMLDQLPTAVSLIRLTTRWSHLELPCIDIPGTYLGIFRIFNEEIDHVRRTFKEGKDDPPIARTASLYSGRVAWARGLQKRLQEGYDEFMKMKYVFYQPKMDANANASLIIDGDKKQGAGKGITVRGMKAKRAKRARQRRRERARQRKQRRLKETTSTTSTTTTNRDDVASYDVSFNADSFTNKDDRDEDDDEDDDEDYHVNGEDININDDDDDFEEADGDDEDADDEGGEVASRSSRASRASRASRIDASMTSLITPEDFEEEGEEGFELREEFRDIFYNFNVGMKDFMTYEFDIHKMWYERTEEIRGGLRAPLLVRDPETHQALSNFDNSIYLFIREAKSMRALGMKIPVVMEQILLRESELFNYAKIQQDTLDDFNETRKGFSGLFRELLRPCTDEMDRTIAPGFTYLRFSSVGKEKFLERVREVATKIKTLQTKIADLLEANITIPLRKMSTTLLVDIPPKGEVWTKDEWVRRNHEFTEIKSRELNTLSCQMENGATQLLAQVLPFNKAFAKRTDIKDWFALAHSIAQPIFAPTPIGVVFKTGNEPEVDEEEEARKNQEMNKEQIKDFLHNFAHMMMIALIKSTRSTLEYMRRRFIVNERLLVPVVGPPADLDELKARVALSKMSDSFIHVDVVLKIPEVDLKPTVSALQAGVTNVVNAVIGVSEGVAQWGQEKTKVVKHKLEDKFNVFREDEYIDEIVESDPKQLQNFKKFVSSHKDVVKSSSYLLEIFISDQAKYQFSLTIKQFYVFQEIWMLDKNETMTQLASQNPSLSEWVNKLKYMDDREKEARNLIKTIPFGALLLHTETFQESISVEVKEWRHRYCYYIHEKYAAKLDKLFAFCDKHMELLTPPINSLPDVRRVMASLDDIKDNFSMFDLKLDPIEDAFRILDKYGFKVSLEEQEKVDTYRFHFKNILIKAQQVQAELVEKQEPLKIELLKNIEKLMADSIAFYNYYIHEGPKEEGISAREAAERVEKCQLTFEDLNNKFEIYTAGERLFALPETDFPELVYVRKELNILTKLYSLYNAVMDTVENWLETLFVKINIEKITEMLDDFVKKSRRLPKALKEYPAFDDMNNLLTKYVACSEVLGLMRNPSMEQRHWDAISEILGVHLEPYSENFRLRNIMDCDILKWRDEVEDICIGAKKEQEIDLKLRQVIADWAIVEFEFGNFKTRGELLLKGTKVQEIQALLEESQMTMGSLVSNRYNAPFIVKIKQWVSNVQRTTDIVETWMAVQNLWVYLEAVFVGGDIAKQLPGEARRFNNIDRTWQMVMQRAHEVTNVIRCCTDDVVLEQTLPHLYESLEACQKALGGYLENKRKLFPRFYFLSDPGLLEILGQASDPHSIQAHLLSIFENMATVLFDPNHYDNIIEGYSKEKERLVFTKAIAAKGNVEIWLQELLVRQQEALHLKIANANDQTKDEEFELIHFINNELAQICILVLQFLWTKEAERALNFSRVEKNIMRNANKYFQGILDKLITQTNRGDLAKLDRVKYEALITIHIHQVDIFRDIHKMGIKDSSDFEWMKQLRFYFKEEEDFTLCAITNVDFIYQNEMLGNTDRLVVTPLTDRCYITLGQAMGMNMGGAPAGPAGTGKTETTKDMGKALGKYVVVFNCSDQMDFRGLGRIYKGLAQSGSWGCFDEFNRIDLPVLSVAAQQITCLHEAKKNRVETFRFTDGDEVTCNIEFGLFITMNPGYAGRQELPENLKIQFRGCAMMVPDRKIIIRVKLAATGFHENIILSEKFFTLYELCEQQLTKQVHYDFGLRNILSVLRTAGNQKRGNPSDSEFVVMMRVLRDMNLSKLVDEDEPLFLSLLVDLFPGLVLTSKTYPMLVAAISQLCDEQKLIDWPNWRLKVIQLYETALVRWGIMSLGPSGAGKTTAMRTLIGAQCVLNFPHKELRMNPKAITAPEMFGKLDAATNDWTDGIFCVLWRRTLKAAPDESVWIVLDGPVDAVWIENLNSVLDDNRLLTLANGDRIPMQEKAKCVFEVHNIDNASPATVSRCGMIFMSASVLTWNPISRGWLISRTETERQVLFPLFERTYDVCYSFVEKECKPKMIFLHAMYARQTCDLLEGLIGADGDNMDPEQLERLYVYALMWSLGALLELNDRDRLEAHMRAHQGHEGFGRIDLPEIPAGSSYTMYEFRVNDKGEWEHWGAWVSDYIYPDIPPEYSLILIPNVDNVRTTYFMHTIAKQGKSICLIGEPGTAKTVMIKNYMETFDKEKFVNRSISFSAETSPSLFQRTMESFVDKRVGTTYGPPVGKKMIVFVDDINMPNINNWGDQVTNEIVRQTIEQRGFYNLEKPGEFSFIEDVQFIFAMMHPGGGRNDIPERLKRHLGILNCTLPAASSIDKIFGSIGCGYYTEKRGFHWEICEVVKKLVVVTRILWQATKVKMLPTPAKFHYVFNLRDLSRIWQGMLYILPEDCPDVPTVVALWKHECTRVFSDRFNVPEDFHWFDLSIAKVARIELGDEEGVVAAEEHYFVDFMRDPPEATGDEGEDFDDSMPKIYEIVVDWDVLINRVQWMMDQYNEFVKGFTLDLVFFRDAMIHILRICRIIRQPRGHALLVGIGGSGKQSLARLSSFICSYDTFQIILSRSYSNADLEKDLKELYRKAGGPKDQGVSFLFTDQEIKSESFLEYLNNILSTGEVGGMFSRDEMEEICGALALPLKKFNKAIEPNPENLLDFYKLRCRKNLHIILCFSPIGEKFRSRSLKFPALVAGCTMDWYFKWPRDALHSVSKHFISRFEMKATDAVREELYLCMANAHHTVSTSCDSYFDRFRRRTYVTPKSYLFFLKTYEQLYDDRRAELRKMQNQLAVGLDKMQEAAESAHEMGKILAVQAKGVDKKKEEANKVKEVVQKAVKQAEAVAVVVENVKQAATLLVEKIMKKKVKADEKLAAAKPMLDAAEKALLTITKPDIQLVSKLAKPPHLIMRIMDVVLILFQNRLDTIQPDDDPNRKCPKPSWQYALKMMANNEFLRWLVEFPRDTITEEVVELMTPYLRMEDYTVQNAKKVCGNVAGLAQWTCAMKDFYFVNVVVLPLINSQQRMEAKHNKAQEELASAEAKLNQVMEEVAQQKAHLGEIMSNVQSLQDKMEGFLTKERIATKLVSSLGGEKERWTNNIAEYEEEISRLVGDALVLGGFITYVGPFNQEYRRDIMNKWLLDLTKKQIPLSPDLNPINFFADAPTISEWNLQGLPNDDLSVQNGILTTKALRAPLLIDPQTQGKTWVKNMEKKNHLMTTQLTHKMFRLTLEDAISQGRPLILEDVLIELDPCLDNVLEKNYYLQGKQLKVKVGDKELDVDKGFMLFVSTKLPNPTYSPEICARTNVIDFAVTMQGLEDQLLGRVIQSEKAELEDMKNELQENMVEGNRKIKEMQQQLLQKLVTIEGSIVDDPEIEEVLNVTQTTVAEVGEMLIIAKEAEIKINIAREEYRPVAIRGSILYFLIVELSGINAMYQTSLAQFLEIFQHSMEKSAPDKIPAKRMRNIITYLTYDTFRCISRGFFEKHKLLYALLIALKIDMNLKRITATELGVLLKGGAALDLNSCPPKPAKWITDDMWLNIVALSNTLNTFADLQRHTGVNLRSWKKWFETDAPEEETLPFPVKLDPFKKLLLIRAWCLDRMISQAKKYIESSMGPKFAEPPLLDKEGMYEESRSNTPLLGLLSQGADPSEDIMRLAKKLGYRCEYISMGQGQEVHARKFMGEAKIDGTWVLFQNCHLSLVFMDEVYNYIQAEELHPEFRIWITSEVHKDFPITMLQSSIKFTSDPPAGMRAGLKRTFYSVSDDLLGYSTAGEWKPLLYAISFFHSAVQERRKFGPLGWNIPYEFNFGDWYACVLFFEGHVDELDPKTGVSWSTVRYMISEIQYGGKVTDDHDRRLLNTYAKVWFGNWLFDPGFYFYKGYVIPIEHMVAMENLFPYLETLPTMDSPEVFGLHSNADITYSRAFGQDVLDTIIEVQPKDSGGGGGESREAAVNRMCDEMLGRMPADFNPFKVIERIEFYGRMESLVICLKQEVDRMQKVIKMTRTTLSELKQAIAGTIIMNEILQNAFDNIYNAKVPEFFIRPSWQSSTIGFWFTELLDRTEQFSNWLYKAKPYCFWLTGFFNPQGFLTAMRQEVTRKHTSEGWALDSVILHNDVLRKSREEIRAHPIEGIYVYGLLLDGGAWDRRNNRLDEQQPKVLYVPLPVVHLYAVNRVDQKKNALSKLYKCPLYRKPRRTDMFFICEIYLRTAKSPDHWALRGVCLLCDIK